MESFYQVGIRSTRPSRHHSFRHKPVPYIPRASAASHSLSTLPPSPSSARPTVPPRPGLSRLDYLSPHHLICSWRAELHVTWRAEPTSLGVQNCTPLGAQTGTSVVKARAEFVTPLSFFRAMARKLVCKNAHRSACKNARQTKKPYLDQTRVGPLGVHFRTPDS